MLAGSYLRRIIVFSITIFFAGCGGVYLTDDIDIEFNFFRLGPPSDELHFPYVQGTKVLINAQSTPRDDDRLNWYLESADPSVLLIQSQTEGRASCLAVGVGSAEIKIFRRKGDAEPIHTSWVEVQAPTRVELYAHGPLLMGMPLSAAKVERPQILRGGTGTFLVNYFDGQTRLYGNGVLRTETTGQISTTEKTSFLFENREWLQISPASVGPHDIKLYAGTTALGTVQVEGVDTVDQFSLLAEDEGRVDEGDVLYVLAQAYSAKGDPIYGAEFSWDLNGINEEGMGDLFVYYFVSDSHTPLGASHGALRQETMVNASSGYVSSTNYVGCSAVPFSQRSTGLYLPIMLLALFLIGRKTRASKMNEAVSVSATESNSFADSRGCPFAPIRPDIATTRLPSLRISQKLVES